MNWTKEELMGGVWPEKFRYGKPDNTFIQFQEEWTRRNERREVRQLISDEIQRIFQPRFITPPETAEFIEALITMTDSRRILELGTCTGFTTLHMLRAIIGKPQATVVSIDPRPEHDRKFFSSPPIAPWFKFMEGWTPDILAELNGQCFDLVFVDSDHTREHTEKEFAALIPITRKGTIFLFHDVPEWRHPTIHTHPPIVDWLNEMCLGGWLRGTILPTCNQLDLETLHGPDYPKECNPHLGVFIRNQ